MDLIRESEWSDDDNYDYDDDHGNLCIAIDEDYDDNNDIDIAYYDDKTIEYKEMLENNVQTDKLCRQALQYNGILLKCITKQTYDMRKMAVSSNPHAIYYVDEQSEDLCIMALNDDAYGTFKWIRPENLTLNVCLHAISIDPKFLGDIENQSEELCLMSLECDPYCIKYIRNSTEEMNLMAVINNGYLLSDIKKQTENICEKAVMNNIDSIKYAKYQNDDLCLYVVNQDGLLLKHCKNKSEKVCLEAVNENGYALAYIDDQTLEMCIAAILNKTFWKNYKHNLDNESKLALIKDPEMRKYCESLLQDK